MLLTVSASILPSCLRSCPSRFVQPFAVHHRALSPDRVAPTPARSRRDAAFAALGGEGSLQSNRSGSLCRHLQNDAAAPGPQSTRVGGSGPSGAWPGHGRKARPRATSGEACGDTHGAKAKAGRGNRGTSGHWRRGCLKRWRPLSLLAMANVKKRFGAASHGFSCPWLRRAAPEKECRRRRMEPTCPGKYATTRVCTSLPLRQCRLARHSPCSTSN